MSWAFGLIAALSVNAPLAEHAVLQAGKTVAVSGHAAAGQKVVIEFAGERSAALSDQNGDWLALIGPFGAATEGRDVLVRSGAERLEVTDVIVGDVWLALGAGGVPSQPSPPSDLSGGFSEVAFASTAAAGAAAGLGPVRKYAGGRWGAPTADVGGRFGVAIQQRFERPIGVVAIGGAAEVAPYSVRGALRLAPSTTAELGGAIPTLRAAFDITDAFPCFAALAPRASANLEVPNTGTVVTLDLGRDGAIAPNRTDEAARRFVLLAKALVYDVAADYSGPVFGGFTPEGAALRLHFRFADNGLIAANKPLDTFEVAGGDHRFYPATATISGSSILVRSPRVRRPVAVRYAWDRPADANLYNGAGLPAAAFSSE